MSQASQGLPMGRSLPVSRAEVGRRGMRVRKLLFHGTMTLIGIIVLVWTLFPVYHMVLVSLRDWDSLFMPSLWPENPTLENYKIVLNQEHFFVRHFWRQLGNSVRVAVVAMVAVLGISLLASFALSRMRFRGQGTVSGMALFTYIIPYSFLSIPFYRIMANYGLLNTHAALTIAMATFTVPYAMWVLSDYSHSIPMELDEAASIDGASRGKIFLMVYLPLMVPAVVAVGTYVFLFSWNEYLYAFLMLSDERAFTLPVSMGFFLNTDDSPWNLMMAQAILYSIPPVILYYLFKRFLVSGLVSGAVKH